MRRDRIPVPEHSAYRDSKGMIHTTWVRKDDRFPRSFNVRVQGRVAKEVKPSYTEIDQLRRLFRAVNIEQGCKPYGRVTVTIPDSIYEHITFEFNFGDNNKRRMHHLPMIRRLPKRFR